MRNSKAHISNYKMNHLGALLSGKVHDRSSSSTSGASGAPMSRIPARKSARARLAILSYKFQ